MTPDNRKVNRDTDPNRDHRQLGRLRDFDDYEVADGSPDVRGWDVIAADGIKYVKVENLIVDPQAMKARYLEVELNKDLTPEDDERHLLVPIGLASLDEENDRVYLGDIDRATLTQIPAYDGGPITRDYEHSVRTALRTDQYDAASQSPVPPSTGSADRPVPPAAVTGAPLSAGTSPVDGTIHPEPLEPREKGSTSDDFYSHKSYDEDAFYKNRRKPGRRD
ncbi:hypothetical protein BH24BAC1_BH24BAC1_19580 [soil metagenome]